MVFQKNRRKHYQPIEACRNTVANPQLATSEKKIMTIKTQFAVADRVVQC